MVGVLGKQMDTPRISTTQPQNAGVIYQALPDEIVTDRLVTVLRKALQVPDQICLSEGDIDKIHESLRNFARKEHKGPGGASLKLPKLEHIKKILELLQINVDAKPKCIHDALREMHPQYEGKDFRTIIRHVECIRGALRELKSTQSIKSNHSTSTVTVDEASYSYPLSTQDHECSSNFDEPTRQQQDFSAEEHSATGKTIFTFEQDQIAMIWPHTSEQAASKPTVAINQLVSLRPRVDPTGNVENVVKPNSNYQAVHDAQWSLGVENARSQCIPIEFHILQDSQRTQLGLQSMHELQEISAHTSTSKKGPARRKRNASIELARSNDPRASGYQWLDSGYVTGPSVTKQPQTSTLEQCPSSVDGSVTDGMYKVTEGINFNRISANQLASQHPAGVRGSSSSLLSAGFTEWEVTNHTSPSAQSDLCCRHLRVALTPQPASSDSNPSEYAHAAKIDSVSRCPVVDGISTRSLATSSNSEYTKCVHQDGSFENRESDLLLDEISYGIEPVSVNVERDLTRSVLHDNDWVSLGYWREGLEDRARI